MTIDEFVAKARAFQASRPLLTALELDVYTAVGDGATAEEVAGRVETDPRATAMLLNALVALEALAKEGDVFRNLPELGPYLVAGAEHYQRPELLHSANLWHSWSSLTDAVRAGGAVKELKVGTSNHPKWTEDFIAAMNRHAHGPAQQLVETVGVRGARRMLDIGGGSGAFSIAFARAAPQLRVEILDTEAVVPLAEGYVAEAGLSDRITVYAGDLERDDLGSGYDLILLSSICHMLSVEQNRDLLRRCRRATAPGGRLIISDFILDENRTRPPRGALFALNMLVGTKGGSTYTESEYVLWMREAGYDEVERLAGDSQLMVGYRV
jgi:2-polyprenyl-3-methyl-5-hydroxy-6-metoxy-1,4-benzoquinol methylase